MKLTTKVWSLFLCLVLLIGLLPMGVLAMEGDELTADAADPADVPSESEAFLPVSELTEAVIDPAEETSAPEEPVPVEEDAAYVSLEAELAAASMAGDELTADAADPADVPSESEAFLPVSESTEAVIDSAEETSAPEEPAPVEEDAAEISLEAELAAASITGDQIAADGTYTATLQGYKEGKIKSGYTATLNVVVSDGEIKSLSISKVSDSKMTKAFNASGYSHYLGTEASISAVDAIDIDAVSGATTSANAGASYKYSINLASAIKTALGTAEEAVSDTAKISLSASTLTVEKGTTGTVTVTPKNCANITVSSNDEAVATAAVSDNTITVTGVETGTAVITVSGTPADEYFGPDPVTLAVEVVEYVQGREIAADGTYSAAIKAYSYGSTSGSAKYSSTVNVTVANGLITAITFSGGDSSKFTDYLINGNKDSNKINIAGGAYYGVVASLDAVDAITSATIAAGTTSTKKYTHTLESSVKEALSGAEKAADQDIPSTIGLSAASLTIDKNATGSVTATVSGCTVTGAVSGNTAVATAEASGNTVVVTGVHAGTAVITVSGAADDGCRTPSDVTFTVTVNPAAEDLISGDDVAADGTYSASIKAYNKSGSAKYTSTINVFVVSSKISDVTFSGGDYSDFNKYYANLRISDYTGQAASINAVDAVSSATTNNGKGKYTINVKQGIIDALHTAPKAVGTPTETISGGQIAADGTYTSTFVINKYKKGQLDKSYTAQLNVSVSGGEITGLWLSNYSDSKVAKYITNDVYNAYIGMTASLSAVQAMKLDAVSSATISTTGGTDSSQEKYYSGDLNAAVINALSFASPAEGGDSGVPKADATYVSGTISAGDSEGSAIQVEVTAAEGTIIDVTLVEDGTVGSWSSLLSKAKSNYAGRTASVEAVDAVTAATMYSAAVKSAVKNAIENGSVLVHDHSFTYKADGGTITATCTGEGDCDITDGLTLSVSAPDASALTYDGTIKAASLSSGYNTTAFPGTYSISYTKGGETFDGTPTDAGSYTAGVTVGGATANVEYTIAKAEVTAPTITDKHYTGSTQTADVAASGLYTVTANDGGTDVGDYDVVLTLMDSANYKWTDSEEAAKTLTFRIVPAETNTVTVSIDGWTYGENASVPASTATFGADTVNYTYSTAEEGKYTADAPTDAGTWYVKASVAATANYPAGEAKTGFVIAKAEITITADDKSSQYGANIEKLTYTVSGDYVDGDALGVTLNTMADKTYDVGEYTITVGWTENSNYTATLTNGTYTITKTDLNVSASGYSGEYNGAAHGITVDVGSADATVYYATEELTAKNYTTAGSTTAITYTNAGKYTVYFYVVSGNYAPDTVSGNKTVTITKVTGTAGDEQKPTAKTGLTYTGEPQPLVNAPSELPGGYTVQYSINNGETWTDAVPTGVNAGDYMVSVKYVGDLNHNDFNGEPVSVTVGKATGTAGDGQKPTAKTGLAENGEEQALVTAPVSLPDGYTKVQYSVDGGTVWTDTVPTGVNAGDYTVSVKYVGDDDHADFEGEAITVTIKAVYTVKFNTNGGTEIKDQTVVTGEKAAKPADPEKNGNAFDGWYQDATFAVPFDFATPITADVTIYAKWTVVEAGDVDASAASGAGAPEATVTVDETALVEAMIENGILTAEEAAKIENGADLDIIVEINDASDSIDAADKTAIDDAAEGMTVGQYLDIDLFKLLTVNGVAGEKTRIEPCGEALTITLTLPDSMKNDDAGVNRTYYIVRVHDGKAELLGATYNAEDGTLTFETDRFSSYAIVYKDTKPESTTKPAATTAKSDSPKTGDESSVGLWIAVMTLCGFGLGGMILDDRKRRTVSKH